VNGVVNGIFASDSDIAAEANYRINLPANFSLPGNKLDVIFFAWEDGNLSARVEVTLHVTFTGGTVKAKVDLNADGAAEMLWWNTTLGDVVVHFLNATDKTAIDKDIMIAQLPKTPWNFAGTGDMDKSGPFDLLWYNNVSGEIVAWNVTANGLNPSVDPVAGAKLITTLPATDWQPVSFGDLNADGTCDIIWQNVNNGIVVGWTLGANYAVTNNNRAIQPDSSGALKNAGWKVVGTADFNNNGTLDLIWWNSNDGATVAWENCQSNSFVAIAQLPPTEWKPIGFGDFGNVTTSAKTPDGKTDVIWQNVTTGQMVVNYYAGTNFSGVPGTQLDIILPPETNWIPVGMN
jgi:hypothetical protein